MTRDQQVAWVQPTIVAKLLGESDDARFQADILRGIRAALQGRRSAPMPAGWETVEAKLAAPAYKVEIMAVAAK